MYEEAQKIFDFLPLKRTVLEEEYASHLWEAFSFLSQNETKTNSYCLMPFHLLFMMSVQNKIQRISNEMNSEYCKIMTIYKHPKKNDLLHPASLFTLSLFEEKTMVDLFSILGLEEHIKRDFKELINFRNDVLGHASSIVPSDAEKRINKYFIVLEGIQKRFEQLNNNLAQEWKKEHRQKKFKEFSNIEFIDIKLPNSGLCSVDFKDGLLFKEFGNLNLEE